MSDYEILHVVPGASFAEVQQAYRDLVRVWHPDRFVVDPRLQKIAEEKLREINRAYLALENVAREPAPPSASEAARSTQTRQANAVQTSYKRSARPHSKREVEISRVPPKSPQLIKIATGAPRTAEFLDGVGEIRVHNRTSEDMLLTLRARVHASARRRITAAAQGDVVLGGLGPDLYTVDVSFPYSQRIGMRLGPFVMLETETASERKGDRYDVTLKP